MTNIVTKKIRILTCVKDRKDPVVEAIIEGIQVLSCYTVENARFEVEVRCVDVYMHLDPAWMLQDDTLLVPIYTPSFMLAFFLQHDATPYDAEFPLRERYRLRRLAEITKIEQELREGRGKVCVFHARLIPLAKSAPFNGMRWLTMQDRDKPDVSLDEVRHRVARYAEYVALAAIRDTAPPV